MEGCQPVELDKSMEQHRDFTNMPDQTLQCTENQKKRRHKDGNWVFPQKLYRIVNDQSTDEVIRWNTKDNINPDSFIITNIEKFSDGILSKEFKHANYQSFTRQLRMYNFQKVNKRFSEVQIYYHPYFKRDEPNLVQGVKRRDHNQTEITITQENVLLSKRKFEQTDDDFINEGSYKIAKNDDAIPIQLSSVCSEIEKVTHEVTISQELDLATHAMSNQFIEDSKNYGRQKQSKKDQKEEDQTVFLDKLIESFKAQFASYQSQLNRQRDQLDQLKLTLEWFYSYQTNHEKHITQALVRQISTYLQQILCRDVISPQDTQILAHFGINHEQKDFDLKMVEQKLLEGPFAGNVLCKFLYQS